MKILNKPQILILSLALSIAQISPLTQPRGLARTKKQDRMTMHITANTAARQNHPKPSSHSFSHKPHSNLTIKPSVNRSTLKTPHMASTLEEAKNNSSGIWQGINNFLGGGIATIDNLNRMVTEGEHNYNMNISQMRAQEDQVNAGNSLQNMKINSAMQIAEDVLAKKVESQINAGNVPVTPEIRSSVNFKRAVRVMI